MEECGGVEVCGGVCVGVCVWVGVGVFVWVGVCVYERGSVGAAGELASVWRGADCREQLSQRHTGAGTHTHTGL